MGGSIWLIQSDARNPDSHCSIQARGGHQISRWWKWNITDSSFMAWEPEKQESADLYVRRTLRSFTVDPLPISLHFLLQAPKNKALVAATRNQLFHVWAKWQGIDGSCMTAECSLYWKHSIFVSIWQLPYETIVFSYQTRYSFNRSVTSRNF